MRQLNLLVLVLVVCSFALAQPDGRTESANAVVTITGRVAAQGKPISGVVITLWHGFSEPTPNTTTATARTEANGQYELKDVPPGNYFISATGAGFVTGKENRIFENVRQVTVVGEKALDPINFEMVAEGVITGLVTDAEGKPVPGIPISVVTEIIPDGAGPPKYAKGLHTDDQGRYRIAGLPAGKYRVAAGYKPILWGTYFGKEGYRRVFYPSAVNEAEAKVIDINAGSEVTGVDINVGRPIKAFTVRARIIDERTGQPIEGLIYSVGAFENGKLIGGAGAGDKRSNERGEIILSNVPQGEYSITVPGNKALLSQAAAPVPNYAGESAHFEVIDKDIADVEVRVTKGTTVAGFVVIEGPAGVDVLARIPQMHLTAWVETTPATPSPLVNGSIKPDGSFRMNGLRAGTLKLTVLPPAVGKPLPLRFVRTERDGVKLERDVELQAGEEITGLRLVMAYATGRIHGIVKFDDGSAAVGLNGEASILENGKIIDGGARLDSRGEFILQNLSAGEYTLAVSARDASNRYWRVEQPIRIYDDKTAEATMVLNSKTDRKP
jgi:carboxypeptidase family protein